MGDNGMDLEEDGPVKKITDEPSSGGIEIVDDDDNLVILNGDMDDDDEDEVQLGNARENGQQMNENVTDDSVEVIEDGEIVDDEQDSQELVEDVNDESMDEEEVEEDEAQEASEDGEEVVDEVVCDREACDESQEVDEEQCEEIDEQDSISEQEVISEDEGAVVNQINGESRDADEDPTKETSEEIKEVNDETEAKQVEKSNERASDAVDERTAKTVENVSTGHAKTEIKEETQVLNFDTKNIINEPQSVVTEIRTPVKLEQNESNDQPQDMTVKREVESKLPEKKMPTDSLRPVVKMPAPMSTERKKVDATIPGVPRDPNRLRQRMNQLYPRVYNIPDEETGFPSFLKDQITRGNFVPINKRNWASIEINADDAIMDCASQIVPLMIKKPTVFPEKFPKEDEKKKVKSEDGVKKEGVEEVESVEEQKPVVQNSTKKTDDKATMLTIPDYFKSSVGQFLVGIGLSRAMEWTQRDNIKHIQRQFRKDSENADLCAQLKQQQNIYCQTKAANSVFTFKLQKCEYCDFKTESEHVMKQHYAVPHVTTKKEYRCNYCEMGTKDYRAMIIHYQEIHRAPCVIEHPPSLYECCFCSHESSQKGKAQSHIAKCMRTFDPDRVQYAPYTELELPAITAKPITKQDVDVYEALLQVLRNAAFNSPAGINPQSFPVSNSSLPRGLQLQMFTMQQALAQKARQLQRNNKDLSGVQANIASRSNSQSLLNSVSHRPVDLSAGSSSVSMTASSASGSSAIPKGASPQLYHMLQSGAAGHAQIMPVSGQKAAQAAAVHPSQAKLRPPGPVNSNQMSSNGKSGSFVICEICDGYTKNLEQLRTHMQWIHKVKIHPKMMASRPPLNCQKCHWRFFTDQGIERHLLGAHGLVTTNMQNMVDQNQDKGRCTICGRIFASKLVAHMNQVHKVTLRPAHLSYKCTVCSATFNLYQLFENHVYMVHNGSVKRTNPDDTNHVIYKKARVGPPPVASKDKVHKVPGQYSIDLNANRDSSGNLSHGNVHIRLKSN